MKRFLMPREHGAYAQLTFPLLSGLLLGAPAAASYLFAAAAVALFLAYEPVVVLLGIRGARLQQEESGTARRQLAVLVPLALLFGAGALFASAPAVRWLALVPAAWAASLLPLVPARRVKTLAGEFLVAAALAGMHLPVAGAGGARGVVLWGPALVWLSGFVSATLAVHAIKARQKQRDRWLQRVAGGIALAGVLVALSLGVWSDSLRALAFALAVPLLAVVVVHAAKVHPRALKRVGWTLVAADTITLALLVLL